MKKLFSLALAVAMVLSLASVAFAVDYVYSVDSFGDDYLYKVPAKKTYVNTSRVTFTKTSQVSFGNTIYYPIFGYTYVKNDYTEPYAVGPVTKYDAVKSVKISTDWDMGSEWVSKTEIVKKRWGSSSTSGTFNASGYNIAHGEYIYFLAITFKSAPNRTSNADVIGEITLKKSSGDNKIDRDGVYNAKGGETPILNIDIELQFALSVDDDATSGGTEITENARKFQFGDDGDYIDEDEEYEFTFEKWSDATFTINTYGQGDIVLKATTDYNADVAALYPEANLDFYVGNGASFNKTGTMYLPADEGTYIYELKNGVLTEIRGAEYDEYDEGFYFKTRTLGVYVVSDVELDLTATSIVDTPSDGGITVVEPGTPSVTPTNPETGAVA